MYSIEERFSPLINQASQYLGNTESAFREHSKELFEGLILSDQMKIYMDNKSVVARVRYEPSIQKCRIEFGLPFLVYLWSVCAYTSMFYYHYIYVPTGISRDPDVLVKLQFPNHLLVLYTDMVKYAQQGLKITLNEWPREFPDPLNSEYDPDMSRAASTFIFALNFIVAHELGHVYCNHFHKNGTIIEKEREADAYAYDRLVGSITENKDDLKFNIGIGSLSALCCLYLKSDPLKYASTTHPEPENRILGMINKLESVGIPKADHELVAISTIEVGMRLYGHDLEIDDKVASSESLKKLVNEIQSKRRIVLNKNNS